MAKVKVKQVKSSINRLQNQKRTLAALGLRGIGKEVIHDANPNILGMIKKVEHLVSVTEA
ncbi:50S ribosomal protein L30 [Flavobacteriaceae bacterium]|nr:50S ribosomal protein L30 [Flavobacteriaceae bacterium]